MTKVQIDASLSSSTKPRTVSIVSKVSQQHIYDANTIFFNNNDEQQAECEQEQKKSEDEQMNTKSDAPASGTGLGLISLKTIPKLFTNLMLKGGENKKKEIEYAVNENVYEYEEQYNNLEIEELDGLINNLKHELQINDDNVPEQIEKKNYNKDGRSNNYSTCMNKK